jgi:peptide/nickel transport system substrate-binding protein
MPIVHLFFVFFLLAGVLLPGQSSSGTLRVGLQADIQGTDPRQVIDTLSSAVLFNVFDNLVTFDDKTLKIVPALAVSWEADPGYRTWTYTLRQGVRFHDGTPFTAEAVVKTLATAPNFPHKVEARGEDKVVVTLARPNANFNQFLAEPYYAIVSPKMPPGGEPSGTGPFRFAGWEKGKKVVITRNADHWRGAPALESVEFVIFGGQDAVLAALQGGSIDLAGWLVPENIKALKANPGLVVDSATGSAAGYLSINTRRKPFDDVRVRRAVAAAINPIALTQKFFGGTAGAPASSMVPPALFSSFSKLAVNRPDEARALLKEAGWDASKTYTLLQIWAPRPYMPDPAGIAEEIRKSLAAVGIAVKVENDPERFFERQEKGDFDLVLNGWIADSGDPVEYVAASLHSDSIGHNNASQWSNEAFDKALDACRVLSGRPFEQKFKEALAMVDDQVPLIPLFYGPQTAAWSKRVQGYTLHPSSQMILHSVRLAPAPGARP